MTTEELRKRLEDDGLSKHIVKNKKSGKYSVVMNNNIIDAKSPKKRIVIFRLLEGEYNMFAMERDTFYNEFEECFTSESINALESWLKKIN